MPKNVRRRHRQISLTLADDTTVLVDDGLEELIAVMNASGLQTLNSCSDDLGTGYVQFRGKLAKPFITSILHQWLNAKNDQPLGGITFANPKNRKWPDSFSIRWNPADYDRLVRYARAALKQIRNHRGGRTPVVSR